MGRIRGQGQTTCMDIQVGGLIVWDMVRNFMEWHHHLAITVYDLYVVPITPNFVHVCCVACNALSFFVNKYDLYS